MNIRSILILRISIIGINQCFLDLYLTNSMFLFLAVVLVVSLTLFLSFLYGYDYGISRANSSIGLVPVSLSLTLCSLKSSSLSLFWIYSIYLNLDSLSLIFLTACKKLFLGADVLPPKLSIGWLGEGNPPI